MDVEEQKIEKFEIQTGEKWYIINQHISNEQLYQQLYHSRIYQE